MKKNAISNSMQAIATGILTDLIYDKFLSASYYEVIFEDKTIHKIVEVNELPLYIQIPIIVLTFFCIWMFLSIIPPQIQHFMQYRKYNYKKIKNTKDVIKLYEENKQTITSVMQLTNNLPNDQKLLYLHDIFVCINNLHSIFCSKNSLQITTCKSVFRTTQSINTKVNYLSKYEFLALISIIQSFLDEATKNNTNTMLKADVKGINDMIKELNNTIKKL